MTQSSLDNWVSTFERKRRTKDALRLLDPLRDINPSEFPLLRYVLLELCYQAAHYRPEQDKTVQRWREYSEIYSKLNDQRQAIKTLRRFIGAHRSASGMAFFASLLEQLNGNTITVNGKQGTPYIDFDKLLRCYSEALEVRNPNPSDFRHEDGKTYSTTLGPLVYPRSLLGQAHLPSNLALTGFALQAIMRLRDWTHDGHVHCHAFGRRMPLHGKPRLGIVAHLASATFERTISENDIKNTMKILQRHPEIGIGHFPNGDN